MTIADVNSRNAASISASAIHSTMRWTWLSGTAQCPSG